MHRQQYTTLIMVFGIVCLMVVVLNPPRFFSVKIVDLEEPPTEIPPKRVSFFEEYRQCVLDGVFDAGKAQMWNNLQKVTDKCEVDFSIRKRIDLKALPNADEVKYVKGPSGGPDGFKPDEECSVVTLGVGHDVRAEEALVKMIPKHCQFFGADPIAEQNRAEYEKVGKFYEMAVGATTGIRTASVLGYKGSNNYQDVNMTHIHFLTFLQENVKRHVIDFLLMDNELAEYDMLPFFLPGGLLDRNNIIICQWNCEFHGTDENNRKKLSDFMIKNIVAGKYIPMYLVTVSHIRSVLINTQDELCLKRYWNEFL